MTVEQLVRDQLDRATEHVPVSPDLEAAITGGRRSRRSRRVGLASAAVAALVAAPLAVSAFVAGHGSAPDQPASVAHQPPAPPVAAPATTDYVPGTDVDETMQAVVADHLDLPAAADIFPSDSAHPGPMTDADFGRATDWVAHYDLDDQQVDIAMGYADPANLSCRGAGCTATPVAGGELQVRESRGWHGTDPAQPLAQWDFVTQFVRGSFYVTVREVIAAPSQAEARTRRTLDHSAVVDLVTDGRLTFPRP